MALTGFEPRKSVNWRIVFGVLVVSPIVGALWSCHQPSKMSVRVPALPSVVMPASVAPPVTLPAAVPAVKPAAKPIVTPKRHRIAKSPPILQPAPAPRELVICAGFHPFREVWIWLHHGRGKC